MNERMGQMSDIPPPLSNEQREKLAQFQEYVQTPVGIRPIVRHAAARLDYLEAEIKTADEAWHKTNAYASRVVNQREDLLAEVERLREALDETFLLAAVAHEGDPWYAEHAGIDADAIMAKARAALHPNKEKDE